MDSTAYSTPSSTPHLRLVEDRAPYDPGFVIVPQQLRDLPRTVDIKDGKKPIPRAAMTGVYVELAAHAIASNVVWPSIKTLAETTGFSEDYVARVLTALERCHILTKSHRDNHGMKRSNQYTLTHQKTPDQQIPPTAGTIPPTAVQDTATGGSGYRPQRHEVDNSERDNTEVEGITPLTPLTPHEREARFERFWNAYPRKVGKQPAWKAWLKLDPDDTLTDRILTAVSVQRQSQQWTKDNGQFIPHPTTWLNGHRWEDELPPAGQGPTPSRPAPQRPIDRTMAAFDQVDAWIDGLIPAEPDDVIETSWRHA